MAESNEQSPKSGKRLGRFVNFKEWVGTEQLGNPMGMFKKVLKRAFVVPSETEKQNFTEVTERMGLAPEELKKKRHAFFRLFIVSIILALLSLLYGIYHLLDLHFRVFFPSLVLCFVCLSFAFRYHFWYFQLKVCRLGCTFKDWLNYILPGKKQ